VTKLRARYRSQILAALLLAGLCLLFFWRIITPFVDDRGYFPSGDFVDQFYAFRVFEARHLLAGHLPLWNPYTYSGHPFLADIQSAVFYPPGLLTIFLSGPWGFPLYALELEAIGHVFLAGLFTYLFARRLVEADFPALVAAVTFAFGGYLTSYPIQQLAILEVQVWLPLILLLLTVAWERWQERRQSRVAVWAGLALGVSLLAGHPQSSMYVLYIAAAYWGFLTYERTRRLKVKAGLFGLFLLTGLGVSAVQLVPGLEFMLLSTRAGGTYQEMAHGFPLHDILQVALPGILSQWSPLYVGILPLLLASLGVYLARRRMVVFWLAVALVALVLSLGGGTILYSVSYLLVPGFSIFRSQERVAFAFSFAMAMLAGYGAQAVFGLGARQTGERIKAVLWSLAGAVGASVALVLTLLWGWLRAGLAADSPFGPMLNRAVLLAVLLLLAAGCLYVRRRELLTVSAVMAVAVVVILFDLFTVNWQNNFQATNPLQDYGPSALLAPIQADADAGRVYNEWRLPGNYGMYYEIEDIGGASPLRTKWYDELLEGIPTDRLWELTGTEYVITWRGTLPVASQKVYEEATGEDVTYLHRLETTYPRAYVVHRAEVLRGEDALERLAVPTFDPLEVAVLEEKPSLELEGLAGASASAVAIVNYGPSRITLDVELEEEGILVLSEVFYPGWRASVDGSAAEIHRANHAFRGVEVDAGPHRVEILYDPVSLKAGALISMISLLSAGAMIGWSVMKQGRGEG
jgi:hypothetical protein